MSGPIAPPLLVFPLAGIAMIITAGYLIALREAPPAAIAPRQARLRTATAWLTLITLPLTAYGFGVTTTANPRTFLLVWVTVTALLAFIFLLASIDLLTLAAHRRKLINAHRQALREARRRTIQLASGAAVPVSEVNYSTHGAWSPAPAPAGSGSAGSDGGSAEAAPSGTDSEPRRESDRTAAPESSEPPRDR